MERYGPESTNLVLNGISVETFGDTDPAITVEDVENRTTLKRGLGGRNLRLDNATLPKRVTVNLMPDSPESRQIIALAKTGVDFAGTLGIVGAGEKYAFFDGILETRGQQGRAGKTSVSDDQFVFVFGNSEET